MEDSMLINRSGQFMKKEITKIGILLGVGLVLLFLSLQNASQFGKIDITWGNTFIMASVFLYPVGIVYGWRQMLGIFRGIRGGDKSDHFSHIGTNTGNFTIWNLVFAFSITICFGWILGVYNAGKKILELK
jgi:hypothetical protein